VPDNHQIQEVNIIKDTEFRSLEDVNSQTVVYPTDEEARALQEDEAISAEVFTEV
jgi:hypothetical protein